MCGVDCVWSWLFIVIASQYLLLAYSITPVYCTSSSLIDDCNVIKYSQGSWVSGEIVLELGKVRVECWDTPTYTYFDIQTHPAQSAG